MYNTKVQTPINTKILDKARKRAENMGFSSINDVIRIMIKQFGDGNIHFYLSTDEQKAIPLVDTTEQKEIVKLIRKNKKEGNRIAKSKLIRM